MKKIILLILAIGIIAPAGIIFWRQKSQVEPANPNLALTQEVWETIKTNYWEKISDEELAKLYQVGLEKLTGKQISFKSANLQGVLKMLVKQAELAPQLNDLVLANLKPFGRSRLYSRKEEQALAENVANYNRATGQIEPSITGRALTNDIYYLKHTKFSPNSLTELEKTANESEKQPQMTTLIYDLCGNIGGSLDLLPYFLGPFIGQNQYAYQAYHQEQKEEVKTQTGWLNSLVKFKKVIILVDQETQSSAEVMAAVLKKYNVGVLVGTKTKGCGTVERVFPLQNQPDPGQKFSVFLVHRLTLREDGEPIEGRGVEPAVNIKTKNWENELYKYTRYPELTKIVKSLIANR